MRFTVAATAKAGIFLCCSIVAGLVFCDAGRATEEPTHPAALDAAIIAAAKRHGVPEHLVRRIIMRESKYNPKARNRLYWGLMQISYPTARSMGFKGTREQLLDPVVNLRYAVPYLATAFVIAGKSEDAAVRLYAAGYYFTARSRGLLSALRTADSPPLSAVPEDQPILAANAVAQPPQSVGIFGALFGPGSQPQPVPQAAAYAAMAPSQPQAMSPQAAVTPAPSDGSAAAPAGTFSGATVEMVPNKKGDLAPPKKWTRDGGMTVIGRGEQGLEQMADRSSPAEEAPRKSAHRRSQKITLVAALDVPPSNAQAYAGAPGQDPRFAAPSQAAIAQVTSGSAPTGQPIDASVQPVAAPTDASQNVVAVDAPVKVEKPKKRSSVRQAKRDQAKRDKARTRQALAEKPPSEAPAQPTAAQ